MPDALIVIEDGKKTPQQMIDEMVRIDLIKCVSVKGVKVYGRPYLTPAAIRRAYYKKIGANER